MNRMGLSVEHLLRYADEGEDMLNRNVTGDESWVHHYQPESKLASMQWKHPVSPSTKKSKVTSSAWKVMLTMFWDSQGVLLAHFQKHGENINSTSYCEVLLKQLMQLMQFVDNVQANCQTPYSPSNAGENSRTAVGTSSASALQLGLGP
jgi:hypothetical protein